MKSTPDGTLLLLLRHGATANNLARPPRLQGRSVDLGLSDAGRDEARRAADFLERFPVSAVYASPLVRAQETALPIAERHGLVVGTIEAITEVDVGDWEGRSWVDIEREESEAYRRFVSDPERFGYRGGENLGQVRDRVVPALEEVATRHRGEMIAVVAHNVVNRCFLATVLGIPLARARAVTQDNGAVNLLRFRDSWKVITLNHVFHLADLPTRATRGSAAP